MPQQIHIARVSSIHRRMVQGREGWPGLVDLLGAAGRAVADLAVVGHVELVRELVGVFLVEFKFDPSEVSLLQGFREHEIVGRAVRDLAVLCELETLLLAGFAGAAEHTGDDLDAAETRQGQLEMYTGLWERTCRRWREWGR